MNPETTNQPETEKFETLMQQLEAAVNALEQEELPLDEAIQQYKLAMKLVTACRARLDEAEQTVNVLIREVNGNWRERPLADRNDASLETNG